METTDATEEFSPTNEASAINRRIKKRERTDSDDEDEEMTSKPSGMENEQSEIIDRESSARKELNDFFSSKGIDLAQATIYRIHFRLNKSRKGATVSTSYSTTYTGPTGGILTSKSDVLNDIKQRMKANTLTSISSINTQREKSHQTSKSDLQSYLDALPADIEGKRVVNFGCIDITNPGFHNSVQIYPIGYKAEMSILNHSALRTPSMVAVKCEISSLDGNPQFIIQTATETYMAVTEAMVWKKVTDQNHQQGKCLILMII